jgi:uncharacterized FAD-dependent dehydrogenase
MIQELVLSLTPGQERDEEKIAEAVLKSIAPQRKGYRGYRVVRRSIDARKKNIRINLKVEAYFDEPIPTRTKTIFHVADNRSGKTVVIIGAGPAGLFAALRLLESGIKPVIIERGKTVRERRRDIAALNKEHIVNPDSNYCFGEGGAGTYSDGKLYTRSTKRGDVQKILELLVDHGQMKKYWLMPIHILEQTSFPGS